MSVQIRLTASPEKLAPSFASSYRRALTLPALVAGWAALACGLTQLGGAWNDFRYFAAAGRGMWAGDPYGAVRALGEYPFYYPGPAAVVLAPFGLLPPRIAFLAFATVSGALFGLAAQRYGRGLLVAPLGAAFLEAITYGQWSPLLVAGTILPWLGGLLAVKPSIGLALFAGWPKRETVVGGLILLAVSLVWVPSWPYDWLQALQATNHVPPVMKPFGWLLLLAWVRWRTPEGRLLGVLALVPQTTALYETVPLFLIPRTKWEGYLLVGLSYAVAVGQHLVAPAHSMAVEPLLAQRWPVIYCGLWLPALAMVLRPG